GRTAPTRSGSRTWVGRSRASPRSGPETVWLQRRPRRSSPVVLGPVHLEVQVDRNGGSPPTLASGSFRPPAGFSDSAGLTIQVRHSGLRNIRPYLGQRG